MANAYVNKVVCSNGDVLIDIGDTTAVAADVNSNKYFYLASGEKVQGSQTFYTVSESLTNVSSSNTASKVLSDSQFHCTLTPYSGYLISSVTVTMGGVDITDQVFTGYDGSELPTVTHTVTESLTNVSTTNESDKILHGEQIYCVLTPSRGYLISSVTVTMNGVDITNQAFTGRINDLGGSTPEPQEINLQSKTVSVTPTESAQTQTVTADSGYDGLDEVEVEVAAISSNYVGSGVTQRSSSDLTVSGATVTAPEGYYSGSASKAVASGSEGIPTATKGSVSNHAVSVTPSVTNTGGYISGGTKIGDAVSVSASELVSGTKQITANGTGIDVTNYESVDVAVPVPTSKAFQYYNGGARVSVTNYTETDVKLTVAKSGTYTISWSGFRSSTSSGTNGSQLYKNDNAVGSAFTSFTNSYWQTPKLTGQQLNEDDEIVVYARSRNTSSYMCVSNLFIVEE